MNLLVPIDGSRYADAALREACRLAGPLDTIIVMAHVRTATPVPSARQQEACYKRRWRAECLLADASALAARYGVDGALLKAVQVEAPNRGQAIRAAVTYWSVARLILTLPTGWYGQLLLVVHPLLRALLHTPPCPLQLLFIPRHHAPVGAIVSARRAAICDMTTPDAAVLAGSGE